MTSIGFEEPLLFDHYEVERVLGSGAMGVVYLARDMRLGRLVALKTLRLKAQRYTDDPEALVAIERFKREAQLCGALLHPNIVTLYEAGYEGQRFTYLAMEYVEGESLQSLMRRSAPVAPAVAARIADDALTGLAYAHEHGIIHRDIKPGNILLNRHGQAKISDFGIATSARSALGELTDRGQLLGTPHYMAPEQIAGREIVARADLFSFGVLLYELLSGRKPFDGAGLTDVLYDIVNRDEAHLETLVPEIPRWLANLVHRLLQKAPEKRFGNTAEVLRELRRHSMSGRSSGEMAVPAVEISVQHERSPEETPTTPIDADDVPQPPPPRLTNRLIPRPVAIGIIAGTILVLGGFIVSLQRAVNRAPTEHFTTGQLQSMEKKQDELREAKLLLDAGAYEESVRRFDEYLTKYPNSVAAQEGRQQAVEALARHERPRVVNGTGPRTARTTVAQSPAPRRSFVEKPRSWWNRAKAWVYSHTR